LIALSGLREKEDVEIKFTGVRPGEKLYEELSLAEEGTEKTRHPKVFIGKIRPHAWDDVIRLLEDLEAASRSGDAEQVRNAFHRIVPEYLPQAAHLVPMPSATAPRATPAVVDVAGAVPSEAT
ncbi:MAG: polysaccharide biosynthesis protein, partial [Polyangiaceae bacterium]